MSNVIVVSIHSAGPPSTQRQTTWLSGVVESTSTTMRRSGPPKRKSIRPPGRGSPVSVFVHHLESPSMVVKDS